MSSSSPGRAKEGSKNKIFSSVPPPALSQKTPTTHFLATWWMNGGDVPLGWFGVVAQWPPQPRLLPLFLPIKIREGEDQKMESVQKENKKKKPERETTREEREHKRGEKEERRAEKVGETERGTKLKEKEEEKKRKKK